MLELVPILHVERELCQWSEDHLFLTNFGLVLQHVGVGGGLLLGALLPGS